MKKYIFVLSFGLETQSFDRLYLSDLDAIDYGKRMLSNSGATMVIITSAENPKRHWTFSKWNVPKVNHSLYNFE